MIWGKQEYDKAMKEVNYLNAMRIPMAIAVYSFGIANWYAWALTIRYGWSLNVTPVFGYTAPNVWNLLGLVLLFHAVKDGMWTVRKSVEYDKNKIPVGYWFDYLKKKFEVCCLNLSVWVAIAASFWALHRIALL